MASDNLADVQLAVMGDPPPATEALIRRHFPSCRRVDFRESDAELRARFRAMAIFGTHHPVDGSVLSAFPAVEIVANCGVGVDHIDVPEANRRGVIVTNTPDVLTDDVADLAIGLLLQTTRRLPAAERFLRSGEWVERSFPLTDTLQGRTVGIVGLGRIGKAIARRLAAFNLFVHYHGRSRQSDVALPYHEDVISLARAVDVLVLTVPGGPGTHHMVGADAFDALGKNGIVINVARGSVIDEPSLIAALAEGTIAAAGLDVFETEPEIDPAFLQLENVVLLPHIGSGTHRTRHAMGQLVVDNLIAHFSGEDLPTAVDAWSPRT